MATQKTTRFPLLVYPALARRWGALSIWLIIAGSILTGVAYWYPEYADAFYPALLLAIIGGVLFCYTQLAKSAHVRCAKSHFVVRAPFYQMGISYLRIYEMRPTDFHRIFPPDQEKPFRRGQLHNLWAKTAIVVELKSYPVPEWWLRFSLGKYVMLPKGKGLVLVTEDWMGLSRQIDTARVEWADELRARRQAKHRR